MSKRQSSNGSRTATERKNSMLTNKRWNTILGVFVVVVVILGITGVLTAAPENQEGTDYPNKVYLPIVSHDTGSVDNSTPTPVSEGIDTSNWKTYTDEVAGFSFKYPEDWLIDSPTAGSYVNVLNTYGYYRSIEFMFEPIDGISAASTDAVSAYASDSMQQAYGEKFAAELKMEMFPRNSISGVKVTNFRSGIHTRVYFSHAGYMYTAALVEGGEIGGGSAYAMPYAQEDEKIFFTVLDTLTFEK